MIDHRRREDRPPVPNGMDLRWPGAVAILVGDCPPLTMERTFGRMHRKVEKELM
jgi:hypothetical protein